MYLLNFNLHEYFQKNMCFIIIKHVLFWPRKKKNLLVQLYVANSEMSGIQKYFSFKEPTA